MELEDEIFLEDDGDIIDIINFGIPTRQFIKRYYFDELDDSSFFQRFRLTKPTVAHVLEQIESQWQLLVCMLITQKCQAHSIRYLDSRE